jgi:hypothetical protein
MNYFKCIQKMAKIIDRLIGTLKIKLRKNLKSFLVIRIQFPWKTEISKMRDRNDLSEHATIRSLRITQIT